MESKHIITLEIVIKSQVRQTKDEERNKKLTTEATTEINKMAISTYISITT